MYRLYAIPGACSTAIQTVLRELNIDFELVHRDDVEDYRSINPTGAVPALEIGDQIYLEGAAIMLHLLKSGGSHLMPAEGSAGYAQALENLMFANATMHPTYGRLFFIAGLNLDDSVRQSIMTSVAEVLNDLWSVVELKLQSSSDRAPYLGGEQVSVADILLAVYSSWGAYFPVDIQVGDKTSRMLKSVQQLPNFYDALSPTPETDEVTS